MADDTFELYDLRVRIEEIRGRCTCDHQIGQYFELKGGKLSLPPGQSFCLYALASTLPLLPTKQRPLHPNDWMSTDARIVCPDPLCGVVMLIERVASRTLHHDDVSAVPLATDEPTPPLPGAGDDVGALMSSSDDIEAASRAAQRGGG